MLSMLGRYLSRQFYFFPKKISFDISIKLNVKDYFLEKLLQAKFLFFPEK